MIFKNTIKLKFLVLVVILIVFSSNLSVGQNNQNYIESTKIKKEKQVYVLRFGIFRLMKIGKTIKLNSPNQKTIIHKGSFLFSQPKTIKKVDYKNNQIVSIHEYNGKMIEDSLIKSTFNYYDSLERNIIIKNQYRNGKTDSFSRMFISDNQFISYNPDEFIEIPWYPLSPPNNYNTIYTSNLDCNKKLESLEWYDSSEYSLNKRSVRYTQDSCLKLIDTVFFTDDKFKTDELYCIEYQNQGYRYYSLFSKEDSVLKAIAINRLNESDCRNSDLAPLIYQDSKIKNNRYGLPKKIIMSNAYAPGSKTARFVNDKIIYRYRYYK